MAVGIKESKELVVMLELLGVGAAKVMKDGKVSAADLPVLLSLFQNMPVILEGIKGIDQVSVEAKDYDSQELMELGMKVVQIVQKIKAEL